MEKADGVGDTTAGQWSSFEVFSSSHPSFFPLGIPFHDLPCQPLESRWLAFNSSNKEIEEVSAKVDHVTLDKSMF